MYEHLARRALPQVLAPFALILGFRALYHPLVEWLLAGAIDIGTAHLWFVLMVGLGRLICWLLAALSALRPPVALRWPCAQKLSVTCPIGRDYGKDGHHSGKQPAGAHLGQH